MRRQLNFWMTKILFSPNIFTRVENAKADPKTLFPCRDVYPLLETRPRQK